jgi:hypothetical protein
MGLFSKTSGVKGFQRAKKSLTEGRDLAVGELRPVADLGLAGYQEIGSLLGLGTGADRQAAFDRFYTSPGIQFAQDEAQRATQRQFAASGMTASGNVLAALQERSQNLASQQFGGYLSQLGAFAAPGLQARQNIAQTQFQFGQQLGNLQIGESQAKAQASRSALGALTGGIAALGSGGLSTLFGGGGATQAATGAFSGSLSNQPLQFGIPGLGQGSVNPLEGRFFRS